LAIVAGSLVLTASSIINAFGGGLIGGDGVTHFSVTGDLFTTIIAYIPMFAFLRFLSHRKHLYGRQRAANRLFLIPVAVFAICGTAFGLLALNYTDPSDIGNKYWLPYFAYWAFLTSLILIVQYVFIVSSSVFKLHASGCSDVESTAQRSKSYLLGVIEIIIGGFVWGVFLGAIHLTIIIAVPVAAIILFAARSVLGKTNNKAGVTTPDLATARHSESEFI